MLSSRWVLGAQQLATAGLHAGAARTVQRRCAGSAPLLLGTGCLALSAGLITYFCCRQVSFGVEQASQSGGFRVEARLTSELSAAVARCLASWLACPAAWPVDCTTDQLVASVLAPSIRPPT